MVWDLLWQKKGKKSRKKNSPAEKTQVKLTMQENYKTINYQSLSPKEKLLGNLSKLNTGVWKNYSSFLSQDEFQRKIKRKFLCFLFGTIKKKSGEYIYIEKIRKILILNRPSLKISFRDLVRFDPVLSIWLSDRPEEVIGLFSLLCSDMISDLSNKKKNLKEKISIKISKFPFRTFIHEISTSNVNKLLKIRGLILSRNNLAPELVFFRLTCLKCSHLQERIISVFRSEKKLSIECISCSSKGPFRVTRFQTIHKSFMKFLTIDPQTDVVVGNSTEKIEIIVKNDHFRRIQKGEVIEFTGIPKISKSTSLSYLMGILNFSFYFDCIFFETFEKSQNYNKFTHMEKKFIFSLVNKRKIVKSISNWIDQENKNSWLINLASVMFLFQDKPKFLGKSNIKSDPINILIYENQKNQSQIIFQKMIYLNPSSLWLDGNFCSNDLLIQSLVQEENSNGKIQKQNFSSKIHDKLILIENFDNLPMKFKNSIKNYSEGEKIIPEKDSIQNLNLSLIATQKNPYQKKNFSYPGLENDMFDLVIPNLTNNDVELNEGPVTLQSFFMERIDRFGFQKNNAFASSNDVPGEKVHKKDFIEYPRIPKNLLRKYILFCRSKIFPQLNSDIGNKLSKLYLNLRKFKPFNDSEGFKISQIRTIIKLVIASARVHLRTLVNMEDFRLGITITLISFFEILFTEENFFKTKSYQLLIFLIERSIV